MSNPLFNTGQNGGPFGNLMGLMTEFNKFASNFKGNPQQKVQELLNSGQMTQAQFDQLSQTAQMLQKMMKG